MAVTIKEVAREANVSPSTVSRVISNHPGISENTKKRVRKAMKELGYHPNLQARSLVGKSTQTIGIVMPNSATQALQNPFFPEVIRGISLKACENMYGVYLTTGKTEEETYEQVVAMVQGRRVDGIILLYSRTDDRLMQYLLAEQFPFTVIGRPYKNAEHMTYVDNDNIHITKRITEHLIQNGHEHIAYIGTNMDFVFTIDRMEGYKQALSDAGIPFDEKYIIDDAQIKKEGKEGILKFLEDTAPLTAIVVADDILAIELLSYTEALNLSIPENISMISFNNILLAEYTKPALTTVDINIFQLGFEAASCLVEKIKNPDVLPRRITIPSKMIERKSVKKIK
ncbi:LacI family DNA-binding transcriptional regulator [Pseudalkalibacillus berkeleyi]|uniref:LacI family transcriptional regulator n=1 Tax=Pseudalkalibacillus berkeleyi TaxID=1069813 RepID=A0ABS9GZ56_9BACL|nr:LacI family DNA-binding transcriptional regulator [Pseudalkalibacillus berkeleyi]MCF6138019.1 LacI family transcriptional regulator [Pseudalkalibacillus berkeleyi]